MKKLIIVIIGMFLLVGVGAIIGLSADRNIEMSKERFAVANSIGLNNITITDFNYSNDEIQRCLFKKSA